MPKDNLSISTRSDGSCIGLTRTTQCVAVLGLFLEKETRPNPQREGAPLQEPSNVQHRIQFGKSSDLNSPRLLENAEILQFLGSRLTIPNTTSEPLFVQMFLVLDLQEPSKEQRYWSSCWKGGAAQSTKGAFRPTAWRDFTGHISTSKVNATNIRLDGSYIM